MGLCCSLPRAQRSRDRSCGGLVITSPHLLPRRRFRHSYGVCAAASRTRGGPVLASPRSQDSAAAMGLCCSLPRARHSRDRRCGGPVIASPRLRPLIVEIPPQLWGLCCSLPRARHSHDRSCGGLVVASPRLLPRQRFRHS